MLGQGGLFQQQNIEKRKTLSVREWAELCARDELRAPGVDEVGLHARANNAGARSRTRRATSRRSVTANANMAAGAGGSARESETAEPDGRHAGATVKREEGEERVPPECVDPASALLSPPHSNRTSPVENGERVASGSRVKASSGRHPMAQEEEEGSEEEVAGPVDEEVKPPVDEEVKPNVQRKVRTTRAREAREARLAEVADKDRQFLESFDPHTSWLPPNTQASSYTTEFCKELERRYWRNCGFGRPPWYGADMQGECRGLSSPRRPH